MDTPKLSEIARVDRQLPATQDAAVAFAQEQQDALLAGETDIDPLKMKTRAGWAGDRCVEEDWPVARREFAFLERCCEWRWAQINERQRPGRPEENLRAPQVMPPSTRKDIHDAYEGVTADDLREAKAQADEEGKALTRAAVRPHVAHNSGENEWYTPADIIEAARQCMNCIDLDPASSSKAQETVRATKFFTIEDDGLAHPWKGRVWLNPPYERGLVDKFVSHLLEQPFEQACVLVNNATETGWAQALLKQSESVCFPSSRIRYLAPDGVKNTPLQGQMICGLGVARSAFEEAFGWHGVVR